MDKICLFGASGHGKVIKECVESEGKQIIVFLDDNPKMEELVGIPVFETKKLKNFISKKFIVSIGNNATRKKICENIKVNFAKVIHKYAIISNSSSIDIGTVIMAGVVVNAETKIGRHCIINSNSVVEHDCNLGDFVHISPNATVTGGVIIGEGTHIGAGAIIIPNIKIGKWAIIGAGSIVVNDIPDYAVVIGNPGKVVKYNK